MKLLASAAQQVSVFQAAFLFDFLLSAVILLYEHAVSWQCINTSVFLIVTGEVGWVESSPPQPV